MSIRIRCICTWEGNINDSLAGKKVRCPDCRGAIQVPPGQVPPTPQLNDDAALKQVPVPPPPATPSVATTPSTPVRMPATLAPPQPRSTAAPPMPATRQAPPATVTPAKKSPASKPDPIFDTWDAEIISEDYGSGADDGFHAPPTARNASAKNSGTPNPPNPWAPPGSPIASRSTLQMQLQGANPLSRLLARIIETFAGIVATLPGIALLAIGGAQSESEGPLVAFTGLGLLFAAIASLAVFQIILYCQGKSIGKKLMGLTVYDTTTGLPAGFMKTFTREVLPNLVSLCVPIVGGIAALVDLCFIFSHDHRRLVDKICNTVVVAD